ncbi:MAG: iron donor protein CyaY [Betaproteobacteria bacterium AqS2]|uniref:Iron donor protein CyaY n=1 Tax=Candidatus Amphirhobacter heronislandensis TaxID=1732024 RepID=A0A930XY29_9GAMM|nr:iron donor protein CyaY [Betaproteobacteria bacterium AqS2]
MDDSTYDRLCVELFDRLDELLAEADAVGDYENNGDICDITLESGAKLIVNRQPPVKEIWLAAPSGGYHFRHADGQWRDTRDGAEFFARLAECMAA